MAHREPVTTEEEPTVGALVADASRDISALIQSEIKLAKAELSVSIKAGGIGAALFALAGFLLLLSLIFGSVAIAYFIAMSGLDLAYCFLIVFGGYVAIAMLFIILGVVYVKKVRAPKRAIAQAKQIPGALKRG
ncbi:MAG TPA: phage holin family protein [Marmoricola sp.]|nr:phage holin family protein [Marmoricola sp.]